MRTRVRMVERRTGVKNSIARILGKHGVSTPDQLPPEGQFAVAHHEEQVAVLDHQVRSIRSELWRQLRADSEVQRLWRVPGIGMLGAMGIRLEVDDIHRFPSVRQFFSYCRVVPGADNSGGRRRHKRSKEGNRYLKLTFSHAAVRAIQNYPTIRSFYQRQARKKNRFIARAIVAKELCRIVLLHAFAASRVRRHLQGQTALEVEEDQVVTSGKPRNRVGLPQLPGRSVASSTEELIGMPGVEPVSYLGLLR